MRRLRLPVVLAVTLGGASCTTGSGPELDARGSAANEHGQPRDGGLDAPGTGSAARDAAVPDGGHEPMPNAP